MKTINKRLLKENLILRAKLVIIRNFMLKTIPDPLARQQIAMTLDNIESSAEIIVDNFLLKIGDLEKQENWDEVLANLVKDIKIP